MTATKMPDWLKAQIAIKTGAQPGARNATANTCTTCGAKILRGHNEDTCAFTIDADPQPVDTLGELLALIQGRGTYDLRQHGRWFRLWRRDHWQVRGRPPGDTRSTFRADVVIEHQCHSPPTSTTASIHTTATSRKQTQNDTQCPF